MAQCVAPGIAERTSANLAREPVQINRGGDGFIQRLTGNESARHAARRAVGSDPIGETFAFGKLEERRPEHAGLIMAAWKD